MLAKRIIPCLDVKNGRVVKGVNFLNLRDAGDPVEAASRYDAQGADEVTYLDIAATLENRRRIAGFRSMYADDYAGWASARSALKAMGGMCREHGVPFVSKNTQV